MITSATLSPCGTYRYVLKRAWGPLQPCPVMFVMLNPSTADASVDDPTIRRCVGFASKWGFNDLTVVNLFALRATDPKELATALRNGKDAVGPQNDEHIEREAFTAFNVVLAWGAFSVGGPTRRAFNARVERVLQLIKPGNNIWTIGSTNGDGSPKHPLYLRADRPLIRWGGAS